jgi:hypothetical protein
MYSYSMNSRWLLAECNSPIRLVGGTVSRHTSSFFEPKTGHHKIRFESFLKHIFQTEAKNKPFELLESNNSLLIIEHLLTRTPVSASYQALILSSIFISSSVSVILNLFIKHLL